MSTNIKLNSGRTFVLKNKLINMALEQCDPNIEDIEEVLIIQQRNNNMASDIANTILSNLSKQSQSSSIIGKMGESYVQDELTRLGYAWQDNSQSAHSADIEIEINGMRIFIDVKKYKSPVPTHEIDKLFRDCEENDIQFGILISLESKISKRKPFEVEQQKGIHIIHVSSCCNGNLKTAIDILTAYVKLNNTHEINAINKENIEKCVKHISHKTAILSSTRAKVTTLSTYVNKISQEITTDLYKYENEINDILLDMKSEVFETVQSQEEIKKRFPYEKWLYILNDLWSDGYTMELVSNNTKKLKTNEGKIELEFYANKMHIYIGTCRLLVETNLKWQEYFPKLRILCDQFA